MDHKWGRNVIDFGLGDLGITLAARRDVGIRYVATNQGGTTPGWFWIWQLPGDYQTPYSRVQIMKAPGRTRFPYDDHAEPDERLGT